MEENSLSTLAASISGLMQSIGAWAQQVCAQIMPVIAQWYEAMYANYREAGAPYGDTQEGCMRWMMELAEIRRMELEIERIVSQHQGLVYLRKRIAEKHETDDLAPLRNP